MIIKVSGKQLRGDTIVKAVLRSDLAPIPLTFEGDFRVDGDLAQNLMEGKTIEVSETKLIIIKHERVISKFAQGARMMDVVRIHAVLDGVEKIAQVRTFSVIKEKKPFSECLKTCGVKHPIDGDFQVPAFSVFIGYIPTYQVSLVLQEEGRVMNWCAKKKKLIVTRLIDFKNKKAVDGLLITGQSAKTSDFLESHSVPWFYSIKDDASLIHGNKEKPRNTYYVPRKTPEQLQNMTRALVLTHEARIPFSGSIQAGDVVQLTTNVKRVVMTAVHVFKSGTDGNDKQEDYTRLWLGDVRP